MSRAGLLVPLVGRPYRAGADGPDAFDCYGCAARVLAILGGPRLPPRGTLPVAARRTWRRLAGPRDGALVLMGAEGRDRHVGVWLTGLGVMHAIDRLGVVVDDPVTLRFRGFTDLRFYGPT